MKQSNQHKLQNKKILFETNLFYVTTLSNIPHISIISKNQHSCSADIQSPEELYELGCLKDFIKEWLSEEFNDVTIIEYGNLIKNDFNNFMEIHFLVSDNPILSELNIYVAEYHNIENITLIKNYINSRFPIYLYVEKLDGSSYVHFLKSGIYDNYQIGQRLMQFDQSNYTPKYSFELYSKLFIQKILIQNMMPELLN